MHINQNNKTNTYAGVPLRAGLSAASPPAHTSPCGFPRLSLTRELL